MSPLRALLTARLQLAWNTARRDVGLAGVIAAVLVGGATLFGLALPAIVSFTMAWRIGQDLNVDSVAILGGFLAVVVFVFGSVGGLRHRLHFHSAGLRRFPIPDWQLLLAELPISLVEVMPLLGAVCLIGFGAGLVARNPLAAIAIVPLVLQALLWLLVVQHCVGALRRLAVKRPRIRLALVGVAAVAILTVLVARMAGVGMREVVAAAEFLPGTQALTGMREWLDGEKMRGALRQLVPLGVSAAMIFVAVRLHAFDVASEAVVARGGSRAALPWLGRGRSGGIATLLVTQVVGTPGGKLFLAVPAILSSIGVAAFLVLQANPDNLSASLTSALERLPDFPWLALLCVGTPLFGHDLSTNQFGWDRGGIKTLLLLPVSEREMLLGKLLGMAAIFSAQVGLAMLPIPLVHRPGWRELTYGCCAGAMVLIVVGGLGHLLSSRYPRPVRGEGEASRPTPPVLILTQFATVLGTTTVLGLAHRLGTMMSTSAGELIAVATALACCGLVYMFWLLPIAARVLRNNVERLAQELNPT